MSTNHLSHHFDIEFSYYSIKYRFRFASNYNLASSSLLREIHSVIKDKYSELLIVPIPNVVYKGVKEATFDDKLAFLRVSSLLDCPTTIVSLTKLIQEKNNAVILNENIEQISLHSVCQVVYDNMDPTFTFRYF